MSRRKSLDAQVIDGAIEGLQAAICDLKILGRMAAAGSPLCSDRVWIVRQALWNAGDAMTSICPYAKAAKEKAAKAANGKPSSSTGLANRAGATSNPSISAYACYATANTL